MIVLAIPSRIEVTSLRDSREGKMLRGNPIVLQITSLKGV